MNNNHLSELSPSWNAVQDKLILSMELNDFNSAIDLINRIAEKAENQNHHPDITLKNYKDLVITLRTHEKNSITKKDINMAKTIDKLIKE